jgi:hypothetical protein
MDKHLYLKLTAGATTLALVSSTGKADAEQPHTHIENVPFERSVSTLSYMPATNIASKAFGFGESDHVAGFGVGRWT